MPATACLKFQLNTRASCVDVRRLLAFCIFHTHASCSTSNFIFIWFACDWQPHVLYMYSMPVSMRKGYWDRVWRHLNTMKGNILICHFTAYQPLCRWKAAKDGDREIHRVPFCGVREWYPMMLSFEFKNVQGCSRASRFSIFICTAVIYSHSYWSSLQPNEVYRSNKRTKETIKAIPR